MLQPRFINIGKNILTFSKTKIHTNRRYEFLDLKKTTENDTFKT